LADPVGNNTSVTPLASPCVQPRAARRGKASKASRRPEEDEGYVIIYERMKN
jgi:hypothetical protein